MRHLSISLALALLLAAPGASGHGGLPLSVGIAWRDQTLYLPTQYWGVFVGSDDGPWRWICDEAINTYLLRDVLRGGDGTLYATNLQGLTISRDGGCDWKPVTGEIAQLDVPTVKPDPAQPARVWALAVEGGTPVLWRSEDAGGTFQRVYTVSAQAQRGLGISPDGARVVVSALQLGSPSPAPTLYVSIDGGGRFDARVLAPPPPFLRTSVLAVDPRDPKIVYVANVGDPTQVLLRVDSDTGQAAEVLRLEKPIYGVAADGVRLFVATGDGLYYADGTAPLKRSEGLSRAQCAAPRDGKLYACSWNYTPDMAAVARSTDGGVSFSSVFQYDRTKGVLECPERTSVNRTCPSVWLTYASQLGIGVTPEPEPEPMPTPGCSAAPGAGAPGWAGPALLVALVLRRRRRAS